MYWKAGIEIPLNGNTNSPQIQASPQFLGMPEKIC